MEPKFLRKIVLEQLKKVLKEEVKPRPIETVKPSETIERGVVKGCRGAFEVQSLLVQTYPSFKDFLAKQPSIDPLRIRKKLTDGIIGLYFAAAVNSLIRATLGRELIPQRNNMNYGYEYNKRGYRAICRDMEEIKNLALNALSQQNPSGTTPEKLPASPSVDLGPPQRLPGSRTLSTDPSATRDTGPKKEEESIVDPIKDTRTKEEKEIDEKRRAIRKVQDRIPMKKGQQFRATDLQDPKYVIELYDELVAAGIIIKPTTNESLRKSFKRFLKDL